MPARVIFSTGSLYVFDLAYCFQLAAETGFDGIEVMCDHRYSTRDVAYLERLSQHYGLPIYACHTPFSPRLPGWTHPRDEIGSIYRTMELAARLEAETIVVHLPRKVGWMKLSFNQMGVRLPWASPYISVRNWIRYELPRVQEQTAVKIAIENLPAANILGQQIDPTWWNEIETWSRVHNWLTMDTTHWATKGIDPLDAYRAAGGRVCHVHLSNYDGREHRLPHRGRVDLARLLKAMAADHFNGTISLELEPDSLEYQDESALRQNLADSLAFCRTNLSESGK